MRFAFDDEKLMFRDAVRDALAATCGPAVVREAWNGELEGARKVWAQLAGLGVVGMTAPEACGGLDMAPLDLVLLLEESGRAALPLPIVETTAVGIPLLAAVGGAQALALARAAASGDMRLSVGFARSDYVVDADLFLMRHGDDLHGVRPDEAELTQVQSVDGARRLFSVDWTPSPSTLLASSVAGALDDAFYRGACGAAAQLVGLATQLIDVTVEYAKVRHQFGRAIGSFQAVKHHLADALMGVTFARPMVYRAAHSLSHADPDRSLHVSMAKHHASEAAMRASRVALQVHGAIGYSFEYDLHLWMKRVWALAAAWGDAAWHRRRVGEAIL